MPYGVLDVAATNDVLTGLTATIREQQQLKFALQMNQIKAADQDIAVAGECRHEWVPPPSEPGTESSTPRQSPSTPAEPQTDA